MQGSDSDEIRAVARLPHLDIEIVHRRLREGEGEQVLISLQAVPSFRAFGKVLEAANPFLFWARVAEMVWLPWIRTLPTTAPLAGCVPISAAASTLPERKPDSTSSADEA